jgi:hypothetical protein
VTQPGDAISIVSAAYRIDDGVAITDAVALGAPQHRRPAAYLRARLYGEPVWHAPRSPSRGHPESQ